MSYGGANITKDQRAFPPILRLLDEFDQYSRSNERSTRRTNSYTPKFDIKETQDAYLLYGEFPGVDQKDIHIEFTDASTLEIKGHSDRNYNSANNVATNKKVRRVTVEDEEEEARNSVQVKPSNSPGEEADKFWIAERSVGDFQRTFAFPVRVDQDNVKATMKNGILIVSVAKAKKSQGRKITIE